MIVLDEHLSDPLIIADLSSWFSGQVAPLVKLRPGSLIKDDVIPTLLRKTSEPTFVTINVTDFRKRVRRHKGFCIITVALTQTQVNEVLSFLRRLMQLPEFRTKALRMGKVIHVTQKHVEYYEADRRIRRLQW